MTFERHQQQSLAATFGDDWAAKACLPTCFYMLARALGYIKDVTLEDFAQEVFDGYSYDPGRGWLRGHLTAELRQRYGLPIVSWNPSYVGKMEAGDWEKMRASGYIETEREQDWFRQNVEKYSTEALVAAGVPVITTMAPGFSTNGSVHAIILAALKDDVFEIVDPNADNTKSHYSLTEIRQGLSPVGAASVILPYN